jgi:hypothetical protein
LTARLGIILVNNQLDALFSMHLFISLLYMFRTTQCSSSAESNCINTSSGIFHCLWVTVRYAGPEGQKCVKLVINKNYNNYNFHTHTHTHTHTHHVWSLPPARWIHSTLSSHTYLQLNSHIIRLYLGLFSSEVLPMGFTNIQNTRNISQILKKKYSFYIHLPRPLRSPCTSSQIFLHSPVTSPSLRPNIHPSALLSIIHRGHSKTMSETDTPQRKPRITVTVTMQRPIKHPNTKRWRGYLEKTI